ncbi:putative porin [Allomuricauda sp. SCSIO 65647]|uniref:putative porin n=1 Tax=Allomuricauda sp. SCSIO 65647 TaxID=2908843 RepID=UPI001F4545C2|nr:putative porin [Muricauda sp. SCSIO 65647]UJH66480.1 putative porin [Muricauda sp. SCSIO 65647]
MSLQDASMIRHLFFLFLFFGLSSLHSQVDSLPRPQKSQDSTLISKKDKKKKGEARTVSIKDYLVIFHNRDTTFVDTTLTIQKDYKYNFLRRDDFELMPFSNLGQPYNSLAEEMRDNWLYPRIGATAKHFNYKEFEDVSYYNVPTPMTELFFKTTLEQGQLLDALLTLNTSERLNLSVFHRGFRSLGKYQFDQAESSNFVATFNYVTKNGKYQVRAHIAAQNLNTEENGGLSNREQFESGNEEFLDRARADVLFSSSSNTLADNRVLGKRYFLDHQINLFRASKDSLQPKSTLSLGHVFSYETRFYQFLQDNAAAAFGTDPAPFEVPIDDKANLKTMYNQVFATFTNKTLGKITASINHYSYDYFFNSILIRDDGQIDNRLNGEEINFGGKYENTFGRISVRGDFSLNISGDLSGTLLNGQVAYQINDNNSVFGSIHASSKMPNFNTLLFQSDYQNFNWQNNTVFEKEDVKSIAFGWNSKLLGTLTASYDAIDNYTYFTSTASEEDITNGEERAFVRPFQSQGTIDYLKVKLAKEFRWRRWALMNTVMYQNVSQEENVLNVPQVVTRNTLYFSKDVFKKAMYLQTGVTLKYFTAYNTNAYHPLLGEFYVQNREEFGGFPMIDFFINAKIRQTRIYLKAEHLNTVWSKSYNYYAAPEYPYRDFVIRFGLVWNFFS